MKKLKINEKYEKMFNNWNDSDNVGLGKIGYLMTDLEVDLIQNNLCNTSKFRKILHTIIDLLPDLQNKEIMHNEIHNKNYTNLILFGILDIIEE